MNLRLAHVLAAGSASLALCASAAAACLPASGRVGPTSIRGLRVGATADIRDASGAAVQASSASYCVEGGAQLAFAVGPQQAIELVVTTAPGDTAHGIGPGSRLPKLAPIAPGLYRLNGTSQIVVGAAGGRVTFLAAADRLLLEDRGKLRHWLRRLGY